VVWYNRALFEAAGVDEPQSGWTWDDFKAKAEALTDKDGGVWGTAAVLDFRQFWVNTIHQAGGSVISADQKTAQWDTPAAAAGVQYWADIAKAGWSPDVKQLADSDQFSMFLSGKLAMIYAGSWMGLTLEDSEMAKAGDLGVAVLPTGPENNAASTSSLGNVIAVTAEHPDEAYKFVEFLGSREAADIYTQGGIALSAYPEFDVNFVEHFAGKFDAAPITEQIANVFPIPRSFNSPVWMKELNPSLAPVMLGEMSVEDGLAKIQTLMQAALDEEPGND
jgi:multiple sugar transport system substrate-binding protein